MIIEMFLDAIYNIFDILTSFISIPPMPDEVHTFIEQAFDYISAGVGILANYTDLTFLLILAGVIIAIDVGIAIYHFVLWVIKKIPVASIS